MIDHERWVIQSKANGAPLCEICFEPLAQEEEIAHRSCLALDKRLRNLTKQDQRNYRIIYEDW